MSPADIIVLIAAIAAVGGFFGVWLWRKKTGNRKNGCGYCSDCSSCRGCTVFKEKKEE